LLKLVWAPRPREPVQQPPPAAKPGAESVAAQFPHMRGAVVPEPVSAPAPAPVHFDDESDARFDHTAAIVRRTLYIVLLVALAWTGWAFFAFHQFRSALQDGDRISLDRQIDWTSVVGGLRADIQSAAAAPGDPQAPVAANEAAAIDALLTRRALFNFLQAAEVGGRAQAAGSDADPVFGWGRIRYAFFSGSPFAFRVDVGPSGGAARRPVVLLFQWYGDWRLTRVFLPADADMNMIRQALLQADAPPRPQAQAQPQPQPQAQSSPDAPRVVLFEENPPSPFGKRSNGNVVWRAEDTPASAPGGGRRIVNAQITIPGRPLTITLMLRRSLALPVIDLIEVRFQAPPNDAANTIQDVLGILAKPNEESPGDPLAGTVVKVGNDFLFGLSPAENDVRRNMQALVDSPWLGIPFVYGNGARAVLAIEVGRAGAKSIADTLR